MANLIEEVKEKEPEIETDSVNLEQQASIAKQRKRKMSDQSKGLDSEKIRKLTRKVKSTLQQNEGRDKKGKKSTILVFNHHPQNEKKNENQPMVDEEIRRAFPTVLLTILQVPSCAHLEPETLSNLLSLQESPDGIVIYTGIKQQRWSPL